MKTKGFSQQVDLKKSYFELQSLLGITNHMGGLEATQDLAESCHVGRDSYVLDVGCGVGSAACFMAKTYGCTVAAVDIREEMVIRSRERAQEEGVEEAVEVQVADAMNLPFEDNQFDAVVSESVTAFVPDKERAMSEYGRVVKTGGFVGINETTWITPPPDSLVKSFSRIMGVEPESPDGWETLLEGAGLHVVVASPRKTAYLSQFSNELKMVSLKDVIKPWGRLVSLFFTDPVYRKVIKEMTIEATKIPLNVFDYFGYGIFVGTKELAHG
ncbi:MAG: methyltransferase domain-containing protein [Theionarchaea archaeon]|nr:methyltransferase domain-containing protein [Theionarchaea archaeon]MBU7036665.1 methyltransferase domain-containing protein [Theionarchaea archaeon]